MTRYLVDSCLMIFGSGGYPMDTSQSVPLSFTNPEVREVELQIQLATGDAEATAQASLFRGQEESLGSLIAISTTPINGPTVPPSKALTRNLPNASLSVHPTGSEGTNAAAVAVSVALYGYRS